MIAFGNINFIDYTGGRVMQIHVTHNGETLTLSGRGTIECIVEDLRLLEGKYIVMFDIYDKLTASSQIKWRDSVGDTIHIKMSLGSYLSEPGLVYGQVTFAQRSNWKVIPSTAT